MTAGIPAVNAASAIVVAILRYIFAAREGV